MCRLVVVWSVTIRNANWTVAIQRLRRRRTVLVDLQRKTGDSQVLVQGRTRCLSKGTSKTLQCNPTTFNFVAKLQFLEKDWNKRLGNRFASTGDIQDQPFFKPIDWQALESRQLEPPFKPCLVSIKLHFKNWVAS